MSQNVSEVLKQWMQGLSEDYNELDCNNECSHPFIGKPIKYQVVDQNGNVIEEKGLGVCTGISFDLGGQPLDSESISFTWKGEHNEV